MLVKKLKTIHIGNQTPQGNEADEVKYLLTVDIARMAKLVGVPLSDLRYALRNVDGQQFYGTARETQYFADLAAKPGTRTLSLTEVDMRITDRVRSDASDSFLIVPLTITNAKRVGDLTDHNGASYHLIPHVQAWYYVNPEGLEATGQYIFGEREFPDVNVQYRVVGFDLLLLPKSDSSAHHSNGILSVLARDPVPTEEEANATVLEDPRQSPWVEIDFPNGEDKLNELALRKFVNRNVERYRYELSGPEFFFAVEADTDKDVTIYGVRNTALDYFQRLGDTRTVQLLRTLSSGTQDQ